MGLAPGPAYGAILRRLLKAKLDGEAPDPASQEALAAELVRLAREGRLEIPKSTKQRKAREAGRQAPVQNAGQDAGAAAQERSEPEAAPELVPEAAPSSA